MSFHELYFEFDNKKSEEFPIYIVSIDSGMIDTEISGSRSLKYEKTAYNDDIFFYKTDVDTMKFSITISPLEGAWTEELKFELFKWLYSRTPKPFKSCDFLGKMCYCVCTNALSLTTNYLKNGYMKLEFECTTNYWLSDIQRIVKDLSDITVPTFIDIECKTNVMHPLYNEIVYLPKINIDLKGSSNKITLTNYSYNGEQFGFTGLSINESLEIDNNLKKVKSSTGLNRINNMISNHSWCKLTYGLNHILISDPCVIEFVLQVPIYL
jgi:hypothetical protein